MQLQRRHAACLATVTGLSTAVGLVVGTVPADAALNGEASYVCTTPTGVHNVRVRVSGDMPRTGTVGEPVGLGRVTAHLLLPKALINDDPGPKGAPPSTEAEYAGAEEIKATARLYVTALQNGQAVGSDWPTFRAVSRGAGAQDGGSVSLTGMLGVPPVRPVSAGKITWTVSGLSVALARTGAASAPLTCLPSAPVELGHVTIGSIPARGAPRAAGTTPGSGGSGLPAPGQEEKTPECVMVPEHKTDPKWDFNDDPILRKVYDEPSLPDPQDPSAWVEFPADPKLRKGLPFCIRASGFTNVKKLSAAAPVGALTLLRRSVYAINPNRATGNVANYQQQRGYFVNEAVPSTASVLSFGFMPTTATTSISQVAPPGSGPTGLATGNLRSDIASGATDPGATRNGVEIGDETWARAYVRLGVSNTFVNGTQLKLGPECGTAPTLLNLSTFTGDYRTGRVVLSDGSTLSGKVDIPQFTRCGVGEDLSPLLTASISGGGNYVRIESGRWCNTAVSTEACDETYEPKTWSITPGGGITITQAPFVLGAQSEESEIRCDSFTMKGEIKRSHWQSRYQLGKIRTAKLSGCTRTSGAERVSVQMSGVNLPWEFHVLTAADDGSPVLRISAVLLNALGPVDGQNCNLRFGDKAARTRTERSTIIQGTYSNASHSFSSNSQFLVTSATDCPTQPPGFEILARSNLKGEPFVISPGQKITQP